MWLRPSPTVADASCARVGAIFRRGYAVGLTILLMNTSGTPDVIDTIPDENGFDSGVDVDPTVGPNVIAVEAEKHPSLTSQVDISDSTSIATVVETSGDPTIIDHMPTLPPFAESITNRPKSINLDDIPLNSPSSQIVGTPFAIDNTRFEYPFPDTNQNCSSGSSSGTSDFSGSVPSSSSSNSFPTLSTSSQILTLLSFPPPSHHPSCNTTHPKMKVQANPPIPPNLVKRRLRWSLGLLGRRKSSTDSQQSSTSDESTLSDIRDGLPSSLPGSLTQERVKR